MKEKDFRALRREEKRKAYEAKKARLAQRRKELAEKRAKESASLHLKTHETTDISDYVLPTEYPDVGISEVLEKLNSPTFLSEELPRRIDMRDVLTFTIDPVTARDYDDALSLRVLDPSTGAGQEGAEYEVGVHIADVTHYVQAGSAVDAEAYRRGTSIYLVDRVIPMLPEELSNDVCSLRPGEDKLTYSVIFRLDAQAHVIKYKVAETVIRSDYRLTYDEVQEVVEGARVQGFKGLSDELVGALRTLNELAKILRQRRMEAGAVDFDREEVVFDLDGNNHPIGVHLHPNREANHLIEEFMLLANRTVATHVGQLLRKPFVYRVHDKPDPGKLADVHKLEKELRDDPLSKHLLVLMSIRAMAKAVYSTDNIGHYGLAFAYYTHFTSPIRRYPDIMVHRLLKHYLSRASAAEVEALEAQCKHCSEMEQVAASAERASIRSMQVAFMHDRLGNIYDGIITHIADWGVYVEIPEYQCEGLIAERYLKNDRIYRLGDRLRVRVDRADLERCHLDFSQV